MRDEPFTYWNDTFGSHCYSKPSEQLRRAEHAMLGTPDALMVKNSRQAWRLLWC